MPKSLLLFPFGGNAREALLSVLALNTIENQWDILGFIDDDVALAGRECCGIGVLGGVEALKRYPDAHILALPGNPNNYLGRRRVIDGLGVNAQRFATIVDPSAAVAPDAMIGRNTVLMRNVVVSCGARVGDHCVILPNTVISHDSVVGNYCCIGSNVSVSGSVKIGPMAYIGSGAKIRDGISIGEKALIGLGSSVIKDVEKNKVVAGNPARIIREVLE